MSWSTLYGERIAVGSLLDAIGAGSWRLLDVMPASYRPVFMRRCTLIAPGR